MQVLQLRGTYTFSNKNSSPSAMTSRLPHCRGGGGGEGWHVALDMFFSCAGGGTYWPIAGAALPFLFLECGPTLHLKEHFSWRSAAITRVGERCELSETAPHHHTFTARQECQQGGAGGGGGFLLTLFQPGAPYFPHRSPGHTTTPEGSNTPAWLVSSAYISMQSGLML